MVLTTGLSKSALRGSFSSLQAVQESRGQISEQVNANSNIRRLDMVFGTAQDVSGLPNSAVENTTIAYFQKAWSTFARNPTGGLSAKLSWPLYSNTTGKNSGVYDSRCRTNAR